MLTLLSPIHAIAARRGDGLRPELARLLVRDAESREPLRMQAADGIVDLVRDDLEALHVKKPPVLVLIETGVVERITPKIADTFAR
jgi:hypothetical protein